MADFILNGIQFTADNTTLKTAGSKTVKFGNRNNGDFSDAATDGIQSFVNAVEIDWNSAKIANTTVNTTGELLKIIDDLYKKVNDVKVTSIELDQQGTWYTDKLNSTITVTATVYPGELMENMETPVVEWSCSTENLVEFSSPHDLSTEITVNDYGQATIYCKATDGTGIKGSFLICAFNPNDPNGTIPPGYNPPPTVPPTNPSQTTEPPTVTPTPDPSTPPVVKVSEITLSQTEPWRPTKIGAQKEVTATVVPANATIQNVMWSSNNTNVARIVTPYESKTVTIEAVGYGEATIYCTSTEGSGINKSFNIYVQEQTSGTIHPIETTAAPTPTKHT